MLCVGGQALGRLATLSPLWLGYFKNYFLLLFVNFLMERLGAIYNSSSTQAYPISQAIPTSVLSFPPESNSLSGEANISSPLYVGSGLGIYLKISSYRTKFQSFNMPNMNVQSGGLVSSRGNPASPLLVCCRWLKRLQDPTQSFSIACETIRISLGMNTFSAC